MAGVRIDSGPLVPEHPLRLIPSSRWKELVSVRRDWLSTRLNYDCRCLVEFVKDAEEMFTLLGYDSADQLISYGYQLEPEEVHLAVRWLELNEPESAVGMGEVLTRAQAVAKAAQATTGEVRSKADNQHTKIGHAQSRSDRAAAAGVSEETQRKLDLLAQKSPALHAKVKAGKKSAHRACVEAGLVKEPTPLDVLRRAWKKATPAERETFRKEALS